MSPEPTPGEQVRRLGLTRRAEVAVLFGTAALFIGAAIVVLFLDLGQLGSNAGLVVIAVLLVVALVFAVPGLVLYRRMPRAASHLRLAAEPLHPPRGGSVRTTLAIADAARVDDPVEVGVVCTGLYDVMLGADPPYGSRRETLQAVVYEHWEKANRSLPSQTIAFTIPRAAPYSYEGRYVSFLWRVRARDASSRITEESLWVEP